MPLPFRHASLTPESKFLLVIKKWSQDNAGTQPDPFKYRIRPVSTCFEMSPSATTDYGDLTSEPTLSGQGNQTPSEKVFDNHRLVLFADNRYYDPSYGTSYAGPPGMEYQSVFGIGKDCINQQGILFMDVRIPNNGQSLTFLP